MNLSQIPTSILIFAITQTAAGFWAIVKMYFALNSLKEKFAGLENENKELKAQLKELSDTLLVVKNNTDLLVLGRLKTGQVKAA